MHNGGYEMLTMQNSLSVNKLDLYSRGIKALRDILGTVDTEEFISLVKSDNFDYTLWQRQHFDQKTPEQINQEAEEYVLAHPYSGDPSTII